MSGGRDIHRWFRFTVARLPDGAQFAGSHVKVILAEKPSVAREIAEFVGARSRRDSYLEGGGYQVTWAFGHLVELKEPEDYDPALKRWSLETLPFVPELFWTEAGE